MVINTRNPAPRITNNLLSFSHKLKRIKRQEAFKNKEKSKFNSLTVRELEILTLLSKGYNNPQISELLFISRYTVEQHRKNINRKLKVSSLLQLFQYSLAFNLV